MSTTYDYQYLVIGAGSGGIASANRAALRGAKKVAVVEGSVVGGTCVNLGCVPKKVLWNGASLLEQIKNYAPDYGFNLELKSIDFAQLVKERQAYIDRIHQSYNNRFNSNQIEYIQGWGSLVDSHTVAIKLPDGNSKLVTAEKILLAPGARPTIPKLPGAEYGIDSDGFFALESLPKRAVVVGAGYIAVELAGVLQAFGTQVQLLTRGKTPLRWADHDVIRHLLDNFKLQGIEHFPETQITHVEKQADGSLLVFTNQGKLETDLLIWAVGREPNTAGLNLENTQVKLDDRGFILTNEFNETNDPAIYAIGDATHMPALTPVAIKAGRLLAERLFNGKKDAHYNAEYVPTVIFSHPAIATVGYSEQQALEKYGAFSAENPTGAKVYKSEFTSMLSAVTQHREKVFMKLVVQGENENVIGLHGIGLGVDEMLQGFAVAMTLGATKADFDRTVAIHPTGAEEFVTMT